jgi:hypothetical protein
VFGIVGDESVVIALEEVNYGIGHGVASCFVYVGYQAKV